MIIHKDLGNNYIFVFLTKKKINYEPNIYLNNKNTLKARKFRSLMYTN